MEAAKAIYAHAETVKHLQVEYFRLTEPFRATFTTTRELFDSGQVAIGLLAFDKGGSKRTRLRRTATTALAGDTVEYLVGWRLCKPRQRSDVTVKGSGPLFRSVLSLLDALYRRQIQKPMILNWGEMKDFVLHRGGERLEQLARVMLDEIWKLFGRSALQPYEVPIVAVAAGIEEPPGSEMPSVLRTKLIARTDKWRKKPSLVARSAPLTGRLIYCT